MRKPTEVNEFGFPHINSWHPYDTHGAALGFGIGIGLSALIAIVMTWNAFPWWFQFIVIPLGALYLWGTPPQNYRMKRP